MNERNNNQNKQNQNNQNQQNKNCPSNENRKKDDFKF